MSTSIHPSAVVDPSARIGDGVVIGPFSIVEEGAVIGDGTVLDGHVIVGKNTKPVSYTHLTLPTKRIV
mgnify:CR=1 FL=1